MATEPSIITPGGPTGTDDGQLGFALNFMSGRGLLTLRDRIFGSMSIKLLELEIPHIAFPFDVTGGADRFKNHHCRLRHLVFGVDAQGLSLALKRSDLASAGFVELKSAIRDGYVEFAGRFAVGEHQADFTFRAALLLRSQEEANVVFYDTRVYGWLPVPSGLLPAYLRRALRVPFTLEERAGMWNLRPGQVFLLNTLPRFGWKIPDAGDVSLTAAECSRGRITFVMGLEHEPNQKQIVEREAPAEAVRAAEGIANFSEAEELLSKGNILGAYDRLREALDDDRAVPWARDRLLQIGAADPELALETRQLAEEVLSKDEQNIQALLALAAIAHREQAYGDAAQRYFALAEIARDNKERYDSIAAELAAAEASAPIDPGGALAAYERAAARARDSVVAHQALFRLRSAQGDWNGAVQAGERLVKIEDDPRVRSQVHRELGQLCRGQLGDLKRARMHYERALRLTPDEPGALEGLAETYAARGEPARAASYLARLAEQAEESGDQHRISSLNLRLGEIWERWLGDPESAAARYHRVLDADPNNRVAMLRLAELAEARGDMTSARSLYEDILAMEEEYGQEIVPDLVAAYTRLARVTLTSEGPTAEAIACLERAVELDPRNRTAREELAGLMRERGDWGRLLKLYEDALASGLTGEEVRLSRINAARIEIEQQRNPEAGRTHLEGILNEAPNDQEALQMLLPILEEKRDVAALSERLAAAAGATPEPVRRSDYLYRLAEARRVLGMGSDEQLRPLDAALDANPYHLPAAKALVDLLSEGSDYARLSDALDRLSVASATRTDAAAALLQRADILWRRLNKGREAETVLREALAFDPVNVKGWLGLADFLEDRGDRNAAWTTLENALRAQLENDGDAAPIHHRQAELARARGDAELEAHHLQGALQTGMRDESVATRLIQVLRSMGRARDVAELLERWAEAGDVLDPDTLLLQSADLRRELEEHDRAREIYRGLIARRGSAALPASRALEEMAREQGDVTAVAEAIEFQLDVAPEGEQQGLLELLLQAHIDAGDELAMTDVCDRLLSREEGSLPARRLLANRAIAGSEYVQAINHLDVMLTSGDRERQPAKERRVAYIKTAALAHEIKPELVPDLQARFLEEFPDQEISALDTPYGTLLRNGEAWESLLALRRVQLDESLHQGEAEDSPKVIRARQEIAEILHEHLERDEDSVPYYQAIVRARPSDTEALGRLVTIYTNLGRWPELARALASVAESTDDAEQAVTFGLRSARVFEEEVQDLNSARESLRLVTQRDDIDVDHRELQQWLRDLSMGRELAGILERSMEHRLAADDGRLDELVGLLKEQDRARDAFGWARRCREGTPEEDGPWRHSVELSLDYPELGEAYEILEEWAQNREGEKRAAVLTELAKVYEEEQEQDKALDALERAAEAHPTSPDMYRSIIARHEHSERWDLVLEWREKLTGVLDEPEDFDTELREIITAALGPADNRDKAIWGLGTLITRRSEETKLLGTLLLETERFEELEALEGIRELFDADQLVASGTGLASATHLDPAREFFDAALDAGADARDVWARAESAWRSARELDGLAKWRLDRASKESQEDAAWLRLSAFAELREGNVELSPQDAGIDFDAESESIRDDDNDAQWAVFVGARSMENTHWLELSALRLEVLLPDDDSRLPSVVKVRLEAELGETGDPDRAVDLAKRLLTLGDDDADIWLERALDQAGRRDELIEFLRSRAESGGPEVSGLWTRVAGLHARGEQWPETVDALDRVDNERRGRQWGELRFDAGKAISSAAMQVEGAEVCVVFADSDEYRAEWLRNQARAQWWLLEDAEGAAKLLKEAHAMSPVNLDELVEKARSVGRDEVEDVRKLLEEGLVVAEGAEVAPVGIELGRLYAEIGAGEESERVLFVIQDRMPGDPDLWQGYAEAARLAELGELEISAWGEAFHLDTERFEDTYFNRLQSQGHWERLVDALLERGGDLSGRDAALRYERAASIARETLNNSQLALDALSKAVRAAPSADNLWSSYRLAVELGQLTAIAALGAPLLHHMDASDGRRGEILRSLVDALDHLQQEHETLPFRHEMLARGNATSQDKLVLGRLLREDDPRGAAALLEEAALEAELQDRPAYYMEAAYAWHALEDDSKASSLLEGAIDNGVDTLDAHRLALDILEGDARLRSVGRWVDLGGDEEWEPERRAAIRVELADGLLGKGENERAVEVLRESAEIHRLKTWAPVMERAFVAIKGVEELAELWVTEGSREDSAWDGSDKRDRLVRAADYYKGREDTAGELEAVEALTRLDPEDAALRERLTEVAAQVGDRDRFIGQARIQIENAAEPAARDASALRYAGILQANFEDDDGAAEMLELAFSKQPGLEVAEALRDIRVGQGRANDVLDLILDAEGDAPEEVRVSLLNCAAGIASSPEGDRDRAHEIFRRVLALDPSEADALNFCVTYAEEQENWAEAITLLEGAGDAARETPVVAASYFGRAADIQNEHLDDTERELHLVAKAYAAQPDERPMATRLMRLQLAENVLDDALETLLAGNVETSVQVELAVALRDALNGSGMESEVPRVMEWVVDNHPHSLAASDYRIDRAREEQDDQALLDVLRQRIEHPATFDEDEKAAFHGEAAAAAVRMGAKEAALEHYVAALVHSQLDPEIILQTVDLAEDLEQEEGVTRAVERASKMTTRLKESADQKEGEERGRWFALLGRIYLHAGDEEAAADAHAEAVENLPGAPPKASLQVLEGAYTRRSDWAGLAGLFEKAARFAEDAKSKAHLHYRLGCLYRDRLVEEAKSAENFAACLESEPDHAEAQLAYGLMLNLRGRFAEARPLLDAQVRLDDADTPFENLFALLEAHRETENLERALEVSEAILIRAPGRTDMHATRAEMLEALGRPDDAEIEWKRYVDAIGPDGNDDEVANIRRRLAKSALRREDIHDAISQLEEAYRLDPSSLETIHDLRVLYEEADRWAEAGELRQREAAATEDPGEQVAHYRELATLYNERLTNAPKAAEMLEQALAIVPEDATVMRDLVTVYDASAEYAKLLELAERLLDVLPTEQHDAPLLLVIGRVYENTGTDLERALDLYARAGNLDPENHELREKRRLLAKATGDFAQFAAVEEEAIPAVEDPTERAHRFVELADTYRNQLSDVEKARAALLRAKELLPEDRALRRGLADTYALDPGTYEQAAQEYQSLLAEEPLEPDVIRILARLTGQIGDTDRAYCLYAALLALEPSDDEARKFVDACRGARPAGPQRPLSDADRAQGLINPDQHGPVEQLFAPLARFAELTQPGDIGRRGVSDRDALPPTDERVQWLQNVLEPMGVAQVNVYLWRGGGFACEVELVGNPPAVLVGSSLADDATDRHRAFLVARAGELYRTGHTLCERLSTQELGGLVAALCLAIEPAANPPTASPESPGWAETVSSRMTDQIRASLAPTVLNYLASAKELDLNKWRRGCLSTACRTALLVACDIEEAISAMLRLRGFDDLTDDQRLAVLKESPEELDMFRFAMSKEYFDLRQGLGLALRRGG